MHWATKKNNPELVKYLLDLGADKNIKNNDQREPAYYAKDLSIKTLLDSGNYLKWKINN